MAILQNLTTREIGIICIGGFALIAIATTERLLNGGAKPDNEASVARQEDGAFLDRRYEVPARGYSHSGADPLTGNKDPQSAGGITTDEDRANAEQNLHLHPCDEGCGEAIFSKLLSGEALTADDALTIHNNASEFAQLLKDKPEEMAALLATLQQDEDNGSGVQNAAYAVLSALSIEEKTQAGAILANSPTPSERRAGLTLLASGLDTNADAVSAFNNLIISETDPRILATAINMSAQLPANENLGGTLNALNSVIHNNRSDYLSGSALVAKATLAPSASMVHADVLDAINSLSEERQEFGLRAFETILELHHEEFEKGDSWQLDGQMRDAINAITHREDANPDLQEQALILSQRYF